MGCLALGAGLAREEEGQISLAVRLGCGPQEVHWEGGTAFQAGRGQSPLDLAGDGVTLPAIWLCWEENRIGASGSLLVAPQQCGSCQAWHLQHLGPRGP